MIMIFDVTRALQFAPRRIGVPISDVPILLTRGRLIYDADNIGVMAYFETSYFYCLPK